jgi:hypothetical protein
MCDPVKQDYHSKDRFDDSKIDADDRLLRHLCIPVQIMTDQQTGQRRISSQAFTIRKTDLGASVDLECLLKKCSMTEVERRGLLPDSYGLVAISAGNVRMQTLGVAWTPKPSEPELSEFAAKPNPFHGEIIGPISKATSRELAAKAALLWVEAGIALGPFEDRAPVTA